MHTAYQHYFKTLSYWCALNAKIYKYVMKMSAQHLNNYMKVKWSDVSLYDISNFFMIIRKTI